MPLYNESELADVSSLEVSFFCSMDPAERFANMQRQQAEAKQKQGEAKQKQYHVGVSSGEVNVAQLIGATGTSSVATGGENKRSWSAGPGQDLQEQAAVDLPALDPMEYMTILRMLKKDQPDW
jgi:hypothetical protein